MRTATFISYICFFFFALLGVVSAAPEPVQAGSILARDVDTVPAVEGLGGLIARGDDDHYKDDYCWKKDGYSKCGKWNYCCGKYQTCCGDKYCCDKGYKCYRKDYKDDDYEYDDEHHKRGDDDYNHGYEWVCKKDKDYHW